MFLAAGLLAVQLAAEPLAPDAKAQAVPPPVKIPEDWTAPPPPSLKASDKLVRELIAEEKKEGAKPSAPVVDTLRGDSGTALAARIEEATVPDCLRADGLKRQPTSIGPFGVSGILALPFVLVAKVRGKCK